MKTNSVGDMQPDDSKLRIDLEARGEESAFYCHHVPFIRYFYLVLLMHDFTS